MIISIIFIGHYYYYMRAHTQFVRLSGPTRKSFFDIFFFIYLLFFSFFFFSLVHDFTFTTGRRCNKPVQLIKLHVICPFMAHHYYVGLGHVFRCAISMLCVYAYDATSTTRVYIQYIYI